MDPPRESELSWLQYMVVLARVADAPERRKFDTLKTHEEQLQFMHEHFKEWNTSTNIIKYEVKDDEKSIKLREEANALYRAKDYIKMATSIAKLYTKSIVFAQPGSRELAIAYANRSALLLTLQRYDECLEDIERSLQNDYPDAMKAKLYARRVKCLVYSHDKKQEEIEEAVRETSTWLPKMEKNANGRKEVEELLANYRNLTVPKNQNVKEEYEKIKVKCTKDNAEIPGASSAIKINYSSKYGRHLIATRDLRAGELVAIVKPYGSILPEKAWYRNCANCLKETMSGIPCNYCVNVIYCSINCRNEAWSDHHEIECQVVTTLKALDFKHDEWLAMHMTVKALTEAGTISNLKKMLAKLDRVTDNRTRGFTDKIFDTTKYASVHAAPRLPGRTKEAGIFIRAAYCLFTTYVLATRSKIFGSKYNNGARAFDEDDRLSFIAAFMMLNCEITQSNLISGNLPYAEEQQVLPTMIRPIAEDAVIISPLTGLLNHSCDENVHVMISKIMAMFSLKPIKEGEMLCHAYSGLTFYGYEKSERQELLSSQWDFICDCNACQYNWPMADQLPTLTDLVLQSGEGDLAKTVSILQCYMTYVEKFKSKGSDLEGPDFIELYEGIVDMLDYLSHDIPKPCQEGLIYAKLMESCCKMAFDPQ